MNEEIKIALIKNNKIVSETQPLNDCVVDDIWNIFEAMELVSRRNNGSSPIVKNKQKHEYDHNFDLQQPWLGGIEYENLGSSLDSFPDQFILDDSEVTVTFEDIDDVMAPHYTNDDPYNHLTLVVSNDNLVRSEKKGKLKAVS